LVRDYGAFWRLGLLSGISGPFLGAAGGQKKLTSGLDKADYWYDNALSVKAAGCSWKRFPSRWSGPAMATGRVCRAYQVASCL
jgi:hypothetical protein